MPIMGATRLEPVRNLSCGELFEPPRRRAQAVGAVPFRRLCATLLLESGVVSVMCERGAAATGPRPLSHNDRNLFPT